MKPTVVYGHTSNNKFRIGAVYPSYNSRDKDYIAFLSSLECLNLTSEYSVYMKDKCVRVYSIPIADCDPADRIEKTDPHLEEISKLMDGAGFRVVPNVEFKKRNLYEIAEEIIEIGDRESTFIN